MTLNYLLAWLNLDEGTPQYDVLPSPEYAQKLLQDRIAAIFVELPDGTEVQLKFGADKP